MRTFEELDGLMFGTLCKYREHLSGDPGAWKLYVKDIKALGTCCNRTKTIVLNRWMVENSSIEQIQDTLMHEIAHAIVGTEISPKGRRMSHGRLWKSWARRLGATPKATVPLSELGDGATDQFSRKRRPYKYHIVYRDKDGTVEKVASCKKKLSRMDERAVKGRPETYGRLWMVPVEDYDDYHDQPNKLLQRMFK